MLFFLLLSFLILCHSEEPYPFKPACDLHDSKHGRETPNAAILNPEPADSSSFFASKEEILEYYKKGKEECEAFIANNENIKTYLHDNHAPFYTDTGHLPTSGQPLCRGRASLHDLTGMTIWPFGPYKECKTYSKCWFGLLACGKFKSSEVYAQTIKDISGELTYILKTYKDPVFPPPANPEGLKWTIRSLILHIRLLGSELVSPDLKLLSLHDDASSIKDDVVIGQYYLTIPDESYQLDIRLAELYPSLFYPWNQQQFEKYGLKEMATIFLGGSETRCRSWTKCPVPPMIAKCDEKSFIVKSPFDIKVIDGIKECPNLASFTSLPICSAANSRLNNPIPSMAAANSFLNAPGRWIHSASKQIANNCIDNKEEYPSYNVILMDHAKEMETSTKVAASTKHSSSATDNPNRHPLSLIGQAKEKEASTKAAASAKHSSSGTENPNRHPLSLTDQAKEKKTANKAAASSKSRPNRHLLSLMDQAKEKVASTTNVAAFTKSHSSSGTDNPNRRPLSFYASGNPCIHNEYLEELKSGHWFYSPYHCRYHFYTRNEIMSCLHSQDITHIHFQGDSISRELFTALSHYLGIKSATEKEMKLLTNQMKQHNIKFYANDSSSATSGSSVLLSEGYSWDWSLDVMKLIEEPPLPNVLVMNHGIAHRATYPYHFEKEVNNTELQYWKKLRNKSLPYPKYMIFQNARELNGKREGQFRASRFREDSTILKRMYLQELGCMELDEFLLSMGKFDNYSPTSGSSCFPLF
jgi:hypothetical protein